jgi:hypothetical protein
LGDSEENRPQFLLSEIAITVGKSDFWRWLQNPPMSRAKVYDFESFSVVRSSDVFAVDFSLTSPSLEITYFHLERT